VLGRVPHPKSIARSLTVSSERPQPLSTTDIVWTAREAMACAYCWSEFQNPENQRTSPETYWLEISERSREECRAAVDYRLLLEVAHGKAAVLPDPDTLSNDQYHAIKTALGLTLDNRVRAILRSVSQVLTVHLTFRRHR
jgi:hypothetical protein